MKTAIVTGASSGIGLAITGLLLQNGWKVYGLSRTQPDLPANSFIWIECDLRQPDSIDHAIQTITEPTIDLVVSNAGVSLKELATDATVDSYEAMFSVNVLAPMLLISGLKEKIKQATIASISWPSGQIAKVDTVSKKILFRY